MFLDHIDQCEKDLTSLIQLESAKMKSKDVECGICFENVSSKEDSRFGLLSEFLKEFNVSYNFLLL